MKRAVSSLIRWTDLVAISAGIIFTGIQWIHLLDVLVWVTPDSGAIITSLKTVLYLLFLLGLAGFCARQMEKIRWPGLRSTFGLANPKTGLGMTVPLEEP